VCVSGVYKSLLAVISASAYLDAGAMYTGTVVAYKRLVSFTKRSESLIVGCQVGNYVEEGGLDMHEVTKGVTGEGGEERYAALQTQRKGYREDAEMCW
jgi:hypothetical protein